MAEAGGSESQYDPLGLLSDDDGVFAIGAGAVLDEEAETRKNIQLIIRIRWIVTPAIFVILLVASLAGVSGKGGFDRTQIVINAVNMGVMLLLNVVYLLLNRRLSKLAPLVIFQLMIDVVHVTLTAYKTGGISSPFSFLYFFVIFEAAMLMSAWSAQVFAAVSAGFYSATTVLERSGLLPHQDFFLPMKFLRSSEGYIVLSWSFTVLSFFGFAALTGYLTRLLEKRRDRLRQAHEVLTKSHETLLLLHRATSALNSFSTVGEVADSILGELLDHLQLDRALLYLVRNDTLQLFMVKVRDSSREAVRTLTEDEVAQGATGMNVELPMTEEAGLTARCAVRCEPYNIQDPEASPYINRELAKRIGMNPFALAPMVLRDQTIGVIGIDRSGDNAAIEDEEFRILQVFANQAAITLKSMSI